MPYIPDGSVDMALCDLPYGTTQNKWDSVIPMQPMWFQFRRVCREGAAMVFTAQTPFDKILGASNIAELKYEWIWKKNVASGHLNVASGHLNVASGHLNVASGHLNVASGHLNVAHAPMKDHENVLVFCRETPTYHPQKVAGKKYRMKRKPVNDLGDNYGNIVRTDTVNDGSRFPKTVLEFDREVGLHPTQKPVALMEYLIRTYTNEGDTVLDSTMGSGTIGVACVNTGRRFIGIELDAEYFKTAKDRISLAAEATDVI